MIKINIKIKEPKETVFKDLNAKIVYPLTVANLLDERLDEAQIVIFDKQQYYKPTTQFELIIQSKTTTKRIYFMLANDQSEEYPKGTNNYKHTLSLIELTKWLEGFFCSSLTFTNVLGSIYTENTVNAIAKDRIDEIRANDDYLGLEFWAISDFKEKFVANITTIVRNGTSIKLPSLKQIADAFSVDYGGTWNAIEEYFNDVPIYSEIKYTINNGAEQTVRPTISENVIINDIQGPTTIEYIILYSEANSTLTAVSAFEFDVSGVTNRYPLEKWTVTRAVNRILECAEPLFKGKTPRFTFDGITYNGDMAEITGGQAEEYQNTYIPEITLTQSNLREQLKVIGSFIHAEPRLTIENNKYKIKFEKYGDFEELDIAKSGKIVYNGSNININDFCTEIRSYAQNIVSTLGTSKGSTVSPFANGIKTLRTEQTFARITEENASCIVDHPIYEISKVYCGIVNDDGSDYLSPVDITDYVFETTKYNALSSFDGEYPYSKEYAINYTISGNKIDGLFFKAPNAVSSTFSDFAIVNILSRCTDQYTKGEIKEKVISAPENLAFSVTYSPITNNFVSHGKQKYENEIPYQKMYNQSENLVEAEYYGENIKGASARLGNVDKTITIISNSIENTPRVAQTVGEYVISEVSSEYLPEHIRSTVSLTKDFNRISQYVGVNSVKHLYEISERQTYQRDILIKENLIIGSAPTEWQDTKANIFNNLMPILKTLTDVDTYQENITCCYIENYKKNDSDFIKVTSGNISENGFIAPVVPRAFGNSIVFSCKPKDNYSAGTVAERINSGSITGKWANEANYTDYYGRVYWWGFYFVNHPFLTEAQQKKLPFEYPILYQGDEIVEKSPIRASGTTTGHYRINKDNREIPTLNVELEIKTNRDDIVIGSAMASESKYLKPVIPFDDYPKLILLTNRKTNKFAKTYTREAGDSDEIEINANFITDDAGTNKANLGIIKLDEYLCTYDITGWVVATASKITTERVVDEDGIEKDIKTENGHKILFASNKEYKTNENIFNDLYIFVQK